MYLSFNHTSNEKYGVHRKMSYSLLHRRELYLWQKNAFGLEGVFYWATKSAISVKKGGFFSSKILEKGVFFKLEYECGKRFAWEWGLSLNSSLNLLIRSRILAVMNRNCWYCVKIEVNHNWVCVVGCWHQQPCVLTRLWQRGVATWRRHQMETFSVLLALCAGKSLFTGEFPSQRPVTRSFDFSFICAWLNGWVNNLEAGDLRRHRAHYDVIVMNPLGVDVSLTYLPWLYIYISQEGYTLVEPGYNSVPSSL